MESRAGDDGTPLEGPVRTCVGCRKRATRSELLRVTAGSDTDGPMVVRPDLDGTALGRGAHLHPTTACYELAVRRKAFARALRMTQGGAGISSAPVSDYLDSVAMNSTDRDWSNSS
ncbi:YlxR family protein [Nocardioides sp. GY 10113]|uniref:YlxR family protein n=1 Tax=Nocardioides sp. GY 10113 TaxID=2569761 RepID=UPI0010A7866F|nr:YlxR family protein [Nocardioides sp. GY 10113]TIC88933.1 YlxR family protein [Nocardioides sp. GY 10113]